MADLPNSKPWRVASWMRRSLLDEETVELPESLRSPVVGSPATPAHGRTVRFAYLLVSVLVGTTAGLGNALVTVNIAQLRHDLNLSAQQAAWVATSYVMTAVSANLLLIKMRQQHGLRRFAVLSLGVYASLSTAHLFFTSLAATVLLRLMSGFAAISLMPLCIFYMMQVFPPKWRLRGIVIAMGVIQSATPLAYVLSPSLLASDGWRSLFLLETGMAILSLAAVAVLRLPPAERGRVFERADLLTYVLVGGGLALPSACLGLGRWVGWLEDWVVASVVASVSALTLGAALDARRQNPLLNVRWLAGGDVARFAVAIFLIRIVLAEQDVAIATVRAIGATADQLLLLIRVMLLGAVAGVLASAASVNIERVARPMMIAAGLIATAALLASVADRLEHMYRFYLAQTAIAFTSTFFVGPALLFGITSALQRGNRELLSFIVLFAITNALGALAGQALWGSFIDWRQAGGSDTVAAHLDTLRLAAGLAGMTTLYLAVLMGLRIRSKLAELRQQAGSTHAVRHTSAMPDPGALDRHWRPPCPHPALGVVSALLSVLGVALILAAWKVHMPSIPP
jgi:MFS family permease